MIVLAARKYPSPRNGPLDLAQHETRRLAYAIKDPSAAHQDYDTVGREMAALIKGPCWLVPVPGSRGDTDANTRLASAIARYCPGAQVVRALCRTAPIESQCVRHKHRLGPTPIHEHHIARTPHKFLALRMVYFVDNVTTSGNTLKACRQAIGAGIGLVFADAGKCETQIKELQLL